MDRSEVIAYLMKLLAPYGVKLAESWLKKRDAKASIKQLSEITDEILEAHSKLPQGSVVEYNEKGWKVTSITSADLSALVNRANVRAQAKQLVGQLCLENVIAEAANELESAKSLPDQKPDPTWMLRFLGYAEGMADTYVKELWGKVLAGEIKQPGSFFLRTLEVLSTMTQHEAELFKLAAKYAFYQPRDAYLPREANLLKRYMTEAGVTKLPGTLDEFVAQVVAATLQRQKHAGAVAIKFEAAYLRSLDFAATKPDDAKRIYAKAAGGSAPSKAEYLAVQDVLFREIVRQAGKLGMAIHIHTGSGCGGYFDLPGSNPGLLTSVLNDASLRTTNFVLIHGGSGAYTQVAAVMMGRPNVYADFSEQDALLSSRAMGEVIRYWLEWYPEKVMFGTDLAPGNEEIGWEEIGYANATTGREGLALALTGMVNDGEISRERALELARMVLRGNAVKLYGLSP